MNPAKEKYKILYYPYLAILFTLLTVYSFFHWLLVIKLTWCDPMVAFSHWIGPIVLSLLITGRYFYSRVKILEGGKNNRQDKTGYICIIWILFAGPAVSSQYLLIDMAGGLEELNNPGEISRRKSAWFYTIKDYKADRYNSFRRECITYTTKQSSGTRNDLFILVPMYGKEDFPVRGADWRAKKLDTASREFHAGNLYFMDGIHEEEQSRAAAARAPVWLCWKYHASVSNRLSQSERKKEMRRFINRSLFDFENTDPDKFIYLRRPSNNDDRDKMEGSVREFLHNPDMTPVVLMPVFESYHRRYYTSLWRFILLLAVACVVWLLDLAYADIDRREWQNYLASRDKSLLPRATTYY